MITLLIDFIDINTSNFNDICVKFSHAEVRKVIS
jgi:hypothetical protein